MTDFPFTLVVHRGLPYREGLLLQKRAMEELAEHPDGRETVFAVEHKPVITLGREGNRAFVGQTQDVEVCESPRGGDCTWHGPGQWTLYPILKLDRRGRDLHRYVRNLEETVMEYLKQWHRLDAVRRPGLTGVWIQNRKLCAIGIHVRRWISGHGLGLNVQQKSLELSRLITPCGIDPATGSVTSVESECRSALDMDTELERWLGCFAKAFYSPA